MSPLRLTPPRPRTLLLLLAAATAPMSCRCQDDEPATTQTAPAPDDDAASTAPDADAPAPAVPPSPGIPIDPADRNRAVETRDEAIGHGPTAAAGDFVSYHYVMSVAGGAVVEDTHSFSAPLRAQLGKATILRPIADGLVGMRPGGKRHLLVPSHLAFGPRGVEGKVPPNADLEITLELLTIE